MNAPGAPLFSSLYLYRLDLRLTFAHTTVAKDIMHIVRDPQTQHQACTTLNSLLEILQNDIKQHLQLIMDRLS